MKVCSLLFLTCLIASVPIIDTGQLGGRVKRIVTQVNHQRGRAKAFGAPVEAAEDLRRHLIKLYLLLRQEGGFSNSHRAWTQHDIALTTHFVSIFYSLNENGFKLPSTHPGTMTSEETNKILVDFMAACFSLFHEETGLIQLPTRDPLNQHFDQREADDFLREVTATFFILFNGGNVLTLQNSSPDVDGELARRLRANYAALLSRAGGLKLPFKGCGENQDQVDRDWPWMAVLLSNRFKWRLFCGAVLVNEWFVLTAAHCLEDKKPDDVTVRLGEYHFREENSSRVDHRVEAIYIHEGFNGTTFDNDIALMQLKEKADLYNSKIWPICLPPNWIDLEDRNAFVAGWGKTSVGGKPSEVLLDAFIPIWKRGECEHLFQSRNDPIDYKLQFCAGPKDGGEDACDGDSGGPLMHKMDSGRWAVIGIVSWGIDGQCAVKGEPGVYTRVSAYTEWIYSKMNSV